MEYIPLNNDSLSPTAEQIKALYQHGFGRATELLSIHELGGGTINRVYRLTLADHSKIILRIAPRHTPDTVWNEAWLMRREYTIQPFFAPLANLTPRILMADFTHELLDRDYLFQSYIEGERWEDIDDALTQIEKDALWDQFGDVLKTIHNVKGNAFGWPHPGQQFQTWRDTLLFGFDQINREMAQFGLDNHNLQQVIGLVHQHAALLDEIQQPRLLHGDLWLFNLMVKRGETPAIVGVLDCDRAWWGDPMVDWTMFVLDKQDSSEMERYRAIFWEAYGIIEQGQNSQFRWHVYEAFHASSALVWATRHDDANLVDQATTLLGKVTERLSAV